MKNAALSVLVVVAAVVQVAWESLVHHRRSLILLLVGFVAGRLIN